MWPFRKKAPPTDRRNWNEDWRVGDVAECIADGVRVTWAASVSPWNRPAFKQRLTVSGFVEGPGVDGALYYFLRFQDWPVGLPTTGFRKVRPVATEKSEIVERILKAKPGADRKREEA